MMHGRDCGCPNCMEFGGSRSWEELPEASSRKARRSLTCGGSCDCNCHREGSDCGRCTIYWDGVLQLRQQLAAANEALATERAAREREGIAACMRLNARLRRRLEYSHQLQFHYMDRAEAAEADLNEIREDGLSAAEFCCGEVKAMLVREKRATEALLAAERAEASNLREALTTASEVLAFGGKCSCHEAYRTRRMQDPDCLWCEYDTERAAIGAALAEARK